jgi:transcriptional regulator with XRE-family HTH domain
MSVFSDELARLMRASGIGVRELARRSGRSAGYISRLRNGGQAPADDTAALLDELLGAAGSLIAAARQREGAPRLDMTAAWHAPDPARSPAPADLPEGLSPVEHLHRLRGALVEQDNLLGPGHVMPVLLDQITLIERLRQSRGSGARDLLLLQAMYAEFAAWCAQDVTDFRAAQFWLDRALELAHMTLDPVWPAYILARKAQLAGDMHDPVHAIGLAKAAVATVRNGHRARLSAAASAYQAQGHAIAGDEQASAAAIETATRQAVLPDEDPSVPWAPWLGPGYVAVHEARCASALGRHGRAAQIYAETVSRIPDRMCRDRGVYTARMALAWAAAGELDAAVAAGLEALSVAQVTRSGRIVIELRRLDSTVARHRTRDTVMLRQALAGVIRPSRRS